MTKKEKVKAFFNKHKKGFIVGSVGLVSLITGTTVAVIKKAKKTEASEAAVASEAKAIFESLIAQSYEENREVTGFAYSEDDNNLIYKSTVKVSTECIGD